MTLVGGIDTHTYFEVAAVATLILLGRGCAPRARPRRGDPAALLELRAKEARVLREGDLVPSRLDGDLFIVRP